MKLTLHNIYLPGRAGRVEEQPRSQVLSLSLSCYVGTGMREPWEGGWWKKRA